MDAGIGGEQVVHLIKNQHPHAQAPQQGAQPEELAVDALGGPGDRAELVEQVVVETLLGGHRRGIEDDDRALRAPGVRVVHRRMPGGELPDDRTLAAVGVADQQQVGGPPDIRGVEKVVHGREGRLRHRVADPVIVAEEAQPLGVRRLQAFLGSCAEESSLCHLQHPQGRPSSSLKDQQGRG